VKLRNQFLTLSLATLLVPWFGWKLVQELETFLRTGQENALLASAGTLARALPAEHQSKLVFGREKILKLRNLAAAPQLDGYSSDWPAEEQAQSFRAESSSLVLGVLAGQFNNQLYLFCTVTDTTPVREGPPANPDMETQMSDSLVLFLRSARGLVSFRIQTAAPGPLTMTSLTEGGGQLQGYWLERPDGYRLELALPVAASMVDLSIGSVDVEMVAGVARRAGTAGTLQDERPATWLSLAGDLPDLDDWLAAAIPDGSRAWLVDRNAWVMADSGFKPLPEGRELSFVERMIYRAVARSPIDMLEARPEQLVRFDEAIVQTALAGQVARHWGQDPDNALVRNTVAVPVETMGSIRGAIVLEANTDALLLVTNRALGRLLLSTLLLTFGLALGLWFFATRLSRRVQRLSSAVSEAMDETGKPGQLPLTGDQDELGDLARNNARLLQAIASYTSYLQKLAGRLSHELKTPLAITRSSLDNLASQPLDEESRRYVKRAREGLDRQAAIVRAMSEASRLEAAVEAGDWETVDLVEVIGHCIEAYRGVYPDREIGFDHPKTPCHLHCAPDLLAQALDKLVENAVSLTGSREQVTVFLDRYAEDVSIGVRNTGSRLPDMLPEQLFDSLVSMREKGGGRHLGLGLHIVRLVAEAHGGRVSARNLDGDAGVEFTLHLPAGA
jgi:dedicated sortase system histidine kinase